MHSLFAVEFEVLDPDGDDAVGDCLAGVRQLAHRTHPNEQPRGMPRNLVSEKRRIEVCSSFVPTNRGRCPHRYPGQP